MLHFDVSLFSQQRVYDKNLTYDSYGTITHKSIWLTYDAPLIKTLTPSVITVSQITKGEMQIVIKGTYNDFWKIFFIRNQVHFL